MRRVRSVLLLSSVSVAIAAACGSSDGSNFGPGTSSSGASGGTSSSSGQASGFLPGDGGGDPDGTAPIGEPIRIEPVDQVLNISTGDPAPTVQYRAVIAATGEPANGAVWAVDRGEIGTIGLNDGLFKASTTFGGKATITATRARQTAKATITIKLKGFENGGTSEPPDGGTGAGGNGGVGGNGPGGSIDNAMVDVLHKPPTADAGLKMLYPYDKTVWPRGIIAPLLMWTSGATGPYDAISIKLKENNFEWEGVYAKNDANFKNHPIPQQAWKTLLSSNEGEDVEVTLTFAKGTTSYGPLTTKWKVASAPLKGVVYYNSYGTRLAKNYPDDLNAQNRFGGAILAVRGGSTDPVLAAGSTGNTEYCRVCHSVAANGSVLITQAKLGGDRKFSSYDLKQAYPAGETKMTPEGSAGGIVQAPYAWPAIYPDGTMFLNDSSSADGSTGTGDGQPGNMLFKTVSGEAPAQPEKIDSTGWPAGLRAAFPAFSPDGKGLAFTMFRGAPAGSKNEKTLGYMPFDNATKTWGPMKALYTSPDDFASIYPAFLPTNDAVIFGVETVYNGRDYGGTRATSDGADTGARGKLYWTHTNVDGTPIVHALDNLNGTGYLPTGPNNHDQDDTLNYEPTVNPVPSGGYAWVVFTSRRLYGNEATINPWWSDPRYHDISQTPTTKKLWVAAIDLNAPAGTDPSHPAFYLPAQELLAGNMRGYWVVDPCKSDGNGCESGDECCGGYCRPGADNKLVCSNVVPTCAQEFEKCSTAADCCNAPDYLCINGRCALPVPGVK